MENPVFRQCGGVCGGVVRKGVYVYVAGGGVQRVVYVWM